MLPKIMTKWFHGHIFTVSARQGGGYDIPLQTRLGTEFLVLLIAMMTYLLLLAAAGHVALGAMSKRWTSGLENTLTIEIPSSEKSAREGKNLVDTLQNVRGVKTARVLDKQDMQKMLSPWLGNDGTLLDDLPLPTLVSVELEERTPKVLGNIQGAARRLSPSAIVDAHEDWLNDLLKLTTGLRLTAMLIFGLILFVTGLVIAGAVRSRMAIHQRELELLHIMGAGDSYITGQFVRYILAQSGKGISIGLLGGGVTLGAFLAMSYQSNGVIPSFEIAPRDWLVFPVVPLALMIIGILSARQTTLRVLRDMP